MSDAAEALRVAERYLKEMLQADDAADLELYVKRYDPAHREGFTREIRFSVH